MAGVNIITKHAPWDLNLLELLVLQNQLLVIQRKKEANVANQIYYVIPEAMNNVVNSVSLVLQILQVKQELLIFIGS